jgi:hypothetical protein
VREGVYLPVTILISLLFSTLSLLPPDPPPPNPPPPPSPPKQTYDEAICEVRKLRKFANDAIVTFKGRATMFDKASLMYHGNILEEQGGAPLTNGSSDSILNGNAVLAGRSKHSSESVHGRDAVFSKNIELKSLDE